MAGADELRGVLSRIDGRGYKAYREIRGAFELEGASLHVDHVQSDPFASPSRMRVRVDRPPALGAELSDTGVRRCALEDWLARRVRDAIASEPATSSGRMGSGKSGTVSVDAGGQEVLPRTAVVVAPTWIEVRLGVGLPASGRRIAGRHAQTLLCEGLPRVAHAALMTALADAARGFVDAIDNQEDLRSQLASQELVAFVADGSILPRESGASDRPLPAGAVPFRAPDALRVELPLLHPIEREGRSVSALSGMGIPRGITLIVGGGYHGKSTLLRAIERGVYPHVPGDGREGVVADAGLVKIRAEDGRRVECVDISSFIGPLPHGGDTSAFDSDDASGSTSQAASIVEALEAGATGLLLDEDTCATNFMVRDARMQALIHKDHEPITPFVERVRELYDQLGVSTLLVMGGCGDYFEVADTVIGMREFQPYDATDDAHRIARESGQLRTVEAQRVLRPAGQRIPEPDSFDAARGHRAVKIDARGVDQILYGREKIDLRGVDQLVDPSQTRAVGHAIHLAARRYMDAGSTLKEILDALDRDLDEAGLDGLDPFHRPGRHPGSYARPRRFEIAAAINRLRSVRMRQRDSDAS